MNPIIVATDFSPAADKAMMYGGALATKLKCELVLVNVYNFPIVPAAEVPLMLMPYDEFQKNSERGLKKSKQKLLEVCPGLLVETKSAVGEIADQLNDQTASLDPILMIVGSRENKEGGVMFGSNTAMIVKHCNRPVLSVPENCSSQPPRIAVLATDLTPIHASALESLRNLVQALQLELHLVHVVETDRGESHEEVMTSLGSLQADFKTVINKDLSDGIEAYTKQVNADLVITLPHSHSWLESLFMKKHTKELVNELHLPLLCIPEK
jgi:nucleotide-binding universal stress UspA family protein